MYTDRLKRAGYYVHRLF